MRWPLLTGKGKATDKYKIRIVSVCPLAPGVSLFPGPNHKLISQQVLCRYGSTKDWPSEFQRKVQKGPVKMDQGLKGLQLATILECPGFFVGLRQIFISCRST